MTLPTMKAGDRVRITVEGEVRSRADSGMMFTLDGSDAPYGMYFDCLTAPTARVEVLEPPVDPDLLLAREACQRYWPRLDYVAGIFDDELEVKAALSAIKAARAGKAVQG